MEKTRGYRRVVFLDILFFLVVLGFLGLFNYDYVMVLVLLALYPYLKFTGRLHLFAAFGVAGVLGLIWAWIAVDYYHYSLTGLKIGMFNLYPVFFWTYGLFVVKLVYSGLQPFFRFRHKFVKLVVFSSLFWGGLVVVEYVVYHVYGIKNLATDGHQGLPLIDAIHAPVWMQVSYFLMGPVYYLLLETVNGRVDFFKAIRRKRMMD